MRLVKRHVCAWNISEGLCEQFSLNEVGVIRSSDGEIISGCVTCSKTKTVHVYGAPL